MTQRHQFEHQRARELAGFLRSRRARINPEQVGFPVGSRRRSQGLRREEVAVLAGVSPTWYTYLEQGRHINPSPEVLDSVAEVLLLTEAERRYVHLLALGHPPALTPQPSGSSDLLADVIGAIGDCPHPLYAENHCGDVIAWNQAAVDWYTDFATLPPGRCNMLWWLMTSPEARQRLPDWAEDARDVVARVRAASATRTHDLNLQSVVAELMDESPQFRRWWNEHDVRDHHTRIRRLRNREGQICSFRFVTLRVVSEPGTAVLLHLPVSGPPQSRDGEQPRLHDHPVQGRIASS